MATPDSNGSHPRPRRVELAPTLAALAVVIAAASLGAWQLIRADEKRVLQAQRDAATAGAPVELEPGADPGALDGRRVRVRGRYLAEHTVFLDNRTLRGVAGFHVATPIAIEGSQRAVLVLRGWVAGDPRERTRLPQVPTPEGVVIAQGIAQATIERSIELGATAEPGAERLWQNLDFARFERWSGLSLVPLLVRETEAPQRAANPPATPQAANLAAASGGADGLVREWPIGGPDATRHLGYAVQWFALALLAAGGWGFYAMSRRRERQSAG